MTMIVYVSSLALLLVAVFMQARLVKVRTRIFVICALISWCGVLVMGWMLNGLNEQFAYIYPGGHRQILEVFLGRIVLLAISGANVLVALTK